MLSTTKRSLVPAVLVLFTSVSGVRAECYYDRYNVERCRLDTSTRVGIGIALFAFLCILIFAWSYARRRRIQRANMLYVQQQQATAANGGQPHPGFSAYGASPYGGPQYPAQAHQTGGYQPYYAPPQGLPPKQDGVEYPPPPVYSSHPNAQGDYKAPV